jgi:sugar phosphate isomerase/epimerase
MMNRREFVASSAAAMAFMAGNKLLVAQTSRPIGLQVYTVREQAEKELPAVLAALHKIGYQEVELYWNLYSHPAPELKRMLNDNGLSAPSGHLDYDGLDTKLDYARELGLKYIICPMLPKSMWYSLDDFKRAADQFNIWGEKVQSMGMRFGFHDHNYEFRRFGDTTGFDTLVARTDPKLVCFEIDCYWITQAGRDPVKTLNDLGRRVRLIHVKDRKPGFSFSQELAPSAEHFTEVGTGMIDWKAVLAAAERTGVEHYFVEQDTTTIPPLESLEISYRNLRKML